MRIGSWVIDPPLVSAPLAGVSDKPFRILVREMGCGLVCTEMVSAAALVYNNARTDRMIDLTGEEMPVSVQIFGSDPEILARAARWLADRGVPILDFNMGCPAPKIVRNGEGAALMRSPERAFRAFAAVVDAVRIPVTVKLRKGFSPDEINVVPMARRLEEIGAQAITVHGRTRDQFYSGNADWECIRETAEAVRVPVIGNGDVWKPEDALRMREQTGCAAVMIGRGSLGNPWLFRQTAAAMQGRAADPPGEAERIRMAIRHLHMMVDWKGERVGVREMRKHLAWYVRNRRGAAACREAINRAETVAEMERLLDGLLPPGDGRED